MRTLRELLTTWETWSARDTLTRAISRAKTTGTSTVGMRHELDQTPAVDPIEALAAAHELVTLLSGWQWQTMCSARENGATWDEIGHAVGTTGEDARANYAAAVERQELHGSGLTDLVPYRVAL